MLTDIPDIAQGQLAEIIDHTIKNGTNMLVIGDAGIGKTDMCIQGAARRTRSHIYLNLSTIEAPDLLGLMEKTPEGKTRYCIPDKFRRAEEVPNKDEWDVLIVDELDKARAELQNPMLELFQFRSINGNKLAIHSVLATGNRPDENAFSRPISHALTNRGAVFQVKSEFEPWQQWAVTSGVNGLIVGFLSRNQDMLLKRPPEGDETAYLHGSPRSWTAAARDLDTVMDRDVDFQTLVVSGHVGNSAAISFKVWLEHYRHIAPLIDNLVMHGKHPPKEELVALERLFVVGIAGANAIVQVAQKADAKKASPNDVRNVTKNVMGWIKTIPTEYSIGALKSVLSMEIIRKYKLMDDKDFLEVFVNIRKAWGEK